MRKVSVWNIRGRRMRLPFLYRADMGRGLLQGLMGLIALGLALLSAQPAHCQRRPLGRPIPTPPVVGQNAPRPNRPGQAREVPDKTVVELLRKMIRPQVEYQGTQKTEVFGQTGQTSEQTIKGDSRGHVRIDFLSPQRVAGDVMLISPGEFHNFHRRDNKLETASWPTEWNDQENRMFGLMRQGVVSARKTGEEQVAGRNAVIIELRLQRPNGQGAGILERKFWIDPETGIQLQIEKYNARGLSSRTTMETLNVGPSASVTAQDFTANFPGANRSPLFPGGAAPFHTLAEAQDRLPFRPLEPANLPSGYHLDGVWIFGAEGKAPKLQASVLMRYTDGVAFFSLYQRLAPQKMPTMPPPRSFKNNMQHWLKGASEGTIMVQYIGHLSAEQVETLYNALH